MKVTIILLLICVALQKQVADLPKLPLYVGRGYDVLDGNPLSNKVDPGFQHGIFQFHYNQKKITEDGKYLIPDEVQHHQVSSCLFSTNIQTYRGTQSYQSQLKTKASISGGYKGALVQAAFSVSTTYQKMQKETIDTNMTVTHAMAQCQAYELSINIFDVPNFEPNFVSAVNESYHSKNWEKFITQFGTHFVYQDIMGGRVIQQISYESHAISKLETLNIDINIAAKASFAKFYMDSSFDWSKHTQQISYSQSVSKTISELYIGGEPSRDGNIHNWVDHVKENPMPITYKVMQISDLFKKVKGLTINVTQAEKDFEDAMDRYCKSKGCKNPIPDKPKPPPAKIQIIKTPAHGGNGGDAFQDIHESPTLNAVKFLMRSGSEVDQIEIMLSDGIKSLYTPKYGGGGGKAQQFQVPKGQYISQVEYHWGSHVTCLIFITNKGTKSIPFGKCSGSYVLQHFPEDFRIIGIYGRSGGRLDQLGFILGKTVFSSNQSKDDFKTIEQNLSIQ